MVSLPRQRRSARAVSIARMQQIDATAIESIGIPRLLLMEHAGLAVARAVTTLASPSAGPILVCCGTGFNGGDGLAAARHLHEWGYPLRLVVTGPLNRLRAEPATYATILQRLSLPFVELPDMEALPRAERALEGCGLIIDALLGIGAQGAVRDPIASLIGRLNRSGKPVIAVDLPSGVNGDTGLVAGTAVKATVTVALGLPKRGCFTGAGPSYAGSVIVDSITIPHALLETD